MTAAVITGASAGLGAEFTRQLVREFPEIEEFWLCLLYTSDAADE